MSVDYTGFGFPKGTPRIVERLEKKRDAAAEEKACRLNVDARDKHVCFFPGCKNYACEKHHIVSSSVRGKRVWQSDDILSACTEHHRFFKAGLIQVTGSPDRSPVTVVLTKLGEEAGICLPLVKRAALKQRIS